MTNPETDSQNSPENLNGLLNKLFSRQLLRDRYIASSGEIAAAGILGHFSSYVISPAVLAEVAPDPDRSPDRLSARWLLALAARLVRDVGALITGAARAGKPVATFALDGEVRFASAADRAAFATELTEAVTTLVSRYHDESAERGRPYRVIVAVHPKETSS